MSKEAGRQAGRQAGGLAGRQAGRQARRGGRLVGRKAAKAEGQAGSWPASRAERKHEQSAQEKYIDHIRPISVLRFWISEGLTQAKS